MTHAEVWSEVPGRNHRRIATITADAKPDDAARWRIVLTEWCKAHRLDPAQHAVVVYEHRRRHEHRTH